MVVNIAYEVSLSVRALNITCKYSSIHPFWPLTVAEVFSMCITE